MNNEISSQQEAEKALSFIENNQSVLSDYKVNDFVFKYIGKCLFKQFNDRVRNDLNKI